MFPPQACSIKWQGETDKEATYIAAQKIAGGVSLKLSKVEITL